MATLVHAAFPRIVSLFVIFALIGLNAARADALTGESQDDAKDLLPPSAQATAAPSGSCDSVDFLPLPHWARDVVMSPLPDVLKPMGRKAVLTTPPVPAPAPLSPPTDNSGSTVVVGKPLVVTPGPAAPSPALIAVSPFLDWIKANPQAAAEKARLQAGAYQAAADPTAAGASATTTPGANGSAPVVVAPTPYWMPPLIDSATFGNSNVSGSSAAIYSTPQR